NGRRSNDHATQSREDPMTLYWNTDRRRFLGLAGGLVAGLALPKRFAWAADANTQRLRMHGDLQVLDPAFMIGGIEEPIMRGIYVSLNRLGDLRQGALWAPHAAEKLEQTDPKTIRFTLMNGLKWTNGFGPVTPED